MTAEIAILSRSAVALAADSAVTIERQIGPKEVEKRALKGANKVFTLSKSTPIAVMIFGDASFMGVPWETLIKMYRSERGTAKFYTLQEYPRDFFSFLENHDSLFPSEAQDAEAVLAMQRYAFMVLGQALRKAETKKTKGKRVLNRIIGEEIDSELTFTKKCSFARGFDAKTSKIIRNKYESKISEIIETVYSEYRISKPRINKLKNVLVASITKIWFKDASAGIVFAGFGEKEHYPSLVGYRCRGIFENVLVRVTREKRSITSQQTAAIEPFAKTSMMNTFLWGVDPDILQAVDGFISAAFKSLLKQVKQHAPDAASEVSSSAMNFRKQFNNDFKEYIFENHVLPTYRIVDALSKEELAELAENLIVMESIKTRIVEPIESVGGPIDVAVISKAEGVIWIKRKHYFDRTLNEDFYIRRQQLLGGHNGEGL